MLGIFFLLPIQWATWIDLNLTYRFLWGLLAAWAVAFGAWACEISLFSSRWLRQRWQLVAAGSILTVAICSMQTIRFKVLNDEANLASVAQGFALWKQPIMCMADARLEKGLSYPLETGAVVESNSGTSDIPSAQAKAECADTIGFWVRYYYKTHP